MSVKLLTEHHLQFLSLKGGFTCRSESTIVKMPHCWKHMSRLIYRGIETSHIGPNLENKVDGTRQLRYHPREISLRWRPCTNGHYQFKIDWLQSLKNVHQSVLSYTCS